MAVLRLVLLLASIQAGPVMAWEEQVGKAAVEKAKSLISKGADAFFTPKGVKNTAKAVYNINKYGHKVPDQTEKQDPAVGGGGGGGTRYNIAIDTVVINDGTGPRTLPVLMVDITAPAAVSIAGSCGPLPVLGVILDLRGGYSNTVSLMTDAGGARHPLAVTLPACPAVAGGGFAVLGLGRGSELFRRFPRFSYQVKSDGSSHTDVWFPQLAAAASGVVGGPAATGTTPLFRNHRAYPSRYYVQITGVSVGMYRVAPQNPLELTILPDGTGGVYLSTTERDTYLDVAVYDRLKAALVQQIKNLNPVPGNGRLCYPRAALQAAKPPPIAIVFAPNNAAVGMEPPPALVGGLNNVWHTDPEGSSFLACLAILPTPPGQTSTIGTLLQLGTTMNIDLTATPGGTLTLSR